MTAPSGAAPQKALMASSDGLPLSVLAMQGFVQLPNCEHKVHFWAAATTAPTQAARTGVHQRRQASAARTASNTSALTQPVKQFLRCLHEQGGRPSGALNVRGLKRAM